MRQVASVLQRELSLRFANVLQPQVAGFNPLYVKATALDPRYYILLDKEQLQHAKTELLREVGAVYQDIQFLPPLYSLISLLFQLSGAEVAVEETVAGTSDSETEPDPETEPPSKRFHYLTSIIKEKRKQQESTHAKTPYLLLEMRRLSGTWKAALILMKRSIQLNFGLRTRALIHL